MGDVLFHSESSAKKFGGTPDDYVPIHKFLDQSKLYIADWRHRALLHTTFGISLCEQMFGDLYTRPSDGCRVSTRTIASQHITEDLGAIPTPETFLREMPIRSWMNQMSPLEKRSMQNTKIESPDKEKHFYSKNCRFCKQMVHEVWDGNGDRWKIEEHNDTPESTCRGSNCTVTCTGEQLNDGYLNGY